MFFLNYRMMLLLLQLLLLLDRTYAGYVCSNFTVSQTNLTSQADFLFLVDNSPSTVTSGLSQFSDLVASSKIDARFAYVNFGGVPRIRLPFSSNVTNLKQLMATTQANGGGQEASLEALRMAFTDNGADMDMLCPDYIGNTRQTCNLIWRSKSTKVVILVTDEDSDFPFKTKYQMPNQGALCVNYVDANNINNCASGGYKQEPVFSPYVLHQAYQGNSEQLNYYRNETNIQLDPAYVAEVKATADLLSQNGVFLNTMYSTFAGTDYWYFMPINVFNDTSAYWRDLVNNHKFSSSIQDEKTVSMLQFGHINAQVQNSDYSGFNASATLKNLAKLKTGNSLQYELLSRNNFNRVFDVDVFVNTANGMINAFYQQLVETTQYIQEKCVYVPDSATKTSTAINKITSTTKSGSANSGGTTTNNNYYGGDSSSGSQGTTTPGYYYHDASSTLGGSSTDSLLTRSIPFQSQGSPLKIVNNGPSNNFPIIPVVAALVGAVGIIGALIAVYRRRLPRRAGMAGGSNSYSLGNIGENPLYGGFENPLYEGRNTGSVENLLA